jgi:hypothetical protein
MPGGERTQSVARPEREGQTPASNATENDVLDVRVVIGANPEHGQKQNQTRCMCGFNQLVDMGVGGVGAAVIVMTLHVAANGYRPGRETAEGTTPTPQSIPKHLLSWIMAFILSWIMAQSMYCMLRKNQCTAC